MIRSLFVNLKSDDWLAKQSLAGQVISSIFKYFQPILKNKTPNLKLIDLEQIAAAEINSNNCTPTFLGYRGFPSAICASVNNTLVHGIPSDYILQDGDIIKIDLGVTYEGAIADAAYTFVYGSPKLPIHITLLKTCRNALEQAVKSVEINKRLNSIGNIISKNSNGFGVITKYGGHGLDWNVLHADPFVSNDGNIDDGIRMQPGLSIAIEPMLVLGKNTVTTVASDKWAVITDTIGAHFENSVTIDSNGKVHSIVEFNDLEFL